MKFLKLTIENFKSFQFSTTIEFPENSDGKSIFLIGGMNGAGKTSVIEALNICLYGAKQDFIYRCINTKELQKGNSFVSFELVFETDELSEIQVKRSWSAGANDKPKARDLEEKLTVIKDGKRVTVENKDMFQDFIAVTIPKGITQFFFFDGEKIQEIAADDHSEIRLKTSLEAALGIQYISKLANDILYLKQDERKNYVEITSEEITYKDSEYKKEKKLLEKKKDEYKDIKQELDNFKTEYDESKKRFEAIFSKEPETIEAIKQKEKRRINLSTRLNQIDVEVQKLLEKYLPYALGGSLFKGIKEQIERETELTQNAFLVNQSEIISEKFIEAIDNPYPLFEHVMTTKEKEELKNRIINLIKQNFSESKGNKILNLSEKDSSKVLSKIEEIQQSEINFLNNLIDEKEQLQSEIKALDYSLFSGASTGIEKELFEELQKTMESCSTQIGRKTEQKRIIEDEIMTQEKKIKELEQEINKLYEKFDISKDKAGFMLECDAIANLLNEFIIKLRKNKIKLLQDKTFEMYRQLSSKSGLIKEITIDEKTYEIMIKDKDGHEIRKSGLSAGEKEIFAVSLLWGLARTSQLNLPIIIDTPLSRLDSVHRDNIINNYFPNAAEQVIILSTDTEIDKNYFKNLEPHLSGAACLVFDQLHKITKIQNGYFWNN